MIWFFLAVSVYLYMPIKTFLTGSEVRNTLSVSDTIINCQLFINLKVTLCSKICKILEHKMKRMKGGHGVCAT